MAYFTSLSKGLLGVLIVGATIFAMWHLLLKPHDEPAPNSSSGQTLAPAQTKGFSSAQAAALPSQKANALSPAQSLEYAETGRKLLNKGDFEQARAHLELAVQSGNPSAACLLGDMTLKGQGGLSADHAQAARLFQFAQSHNIICFSTKP